MTSRRSSGSSWPESSVESAKSQNMTVRCRRSAALSPVTGASLVCVLETTGGGAEASDVAPVRMSKPQLPQKLFPPTISLPQDGQASGSCVPQPPQNRFVEGFSNAQAGQLTTLVVASSVTMPPYPNDHQRSVHVGLAFTRPQPKTWSRPRLPRSTVWRRSERRNISGSAR